MIHYNVIDQAPSSFERMPDSSNLVLFFSLPFKPKGTTNFFLNGHIALGLAGTIYQVYDPKLLKSGFLFSEMPIRDWLFGDGGFWVDRDPGSPQFRHVYLYKSCETKRTVVYYAGVRIDVATVRNISERLSEVEEQFMTGNFTFHLLGNNCSTIIASALTRAGLIPERAKNTIPARFFKGFVQQCGRDLHVEIGKIAVYDESSFEIHRYCIGLGPTDPQRAMDRWIAARMSPNREMVPRVPQAIVPQCGEGAQSR
jgi:hypothetical protein